jgi:hypothetical protein
MMGRTAAGAASRTSAGSTLGSRPNPGELDPLDIKKLGKFNQSVTASPATGGQSNGGGTGWESLSASTITPASPSPRS